MSYLRTISIALLSIIGAVGCSAEKDHPASPSVITISFTPSKPVLQVGATLHLDVEVKGAPVEALVWSSDDKQVATVDDHGTVKGLRAGQTLVSVRLGPNSNTMGAVLVVVQ